MDTTAGVVAVIQQRAAQQVYMQSQFSLATFELYRAKLQSLAVSDIY